MSHEDAPTRGRRSDPEPGRPRAARGSGTPQRRSPALASGAVMQVPGHAPVRARRPRFVLWALVGGLSLLAYVALWLGGRSPWARYVDHSLTASDTGQSPLGSLFFVAGWTVMVTAMMLPTAVPLLDVFALVARRRPQRWRLCVLVTLGFVAVWAAFGYVLTWVDRVVHLVVDESGAIADRPQLIAAFVLVAAGLYQFSSLKRRCLTRCRSPLSFIIPRWSGGSPSADALRIGADYGVSCLGCCWALMLLVFALGTGNVGVMLLVGVVMAVEKNLPRARLLTPALGVTLTVVGIAMGMRALIWAGG